MNPKIILSCVVAFVVCMFGARAQAQSQTTPVVPGFYTLLNNPIPAAGVTNGTLVSPWTTNLANGWTNITYSTNIQTLWNSSSNSFVATTNITTNNSVLYLGGSAANQQYNPIQFEYLGKNNSNVVWQISRSVTGVNYATTNSPDIVYATNSCNWGTNTVATYQLDMRGYEFWRVTQIAWYDTNFSDTFSNIATYDSTKKN